LDVEVLEALDWAALDLEALDFAAGGFLLIDLRCGDEEREAMWFEPVLSVST
jgi:hypothetical protein